MNETPRQYARDLRAKWERADTVKRARAQQISQERQAQGMTQKQLAKLANLHPTTLSRAELTGPGTRTYRTIHKALKLPRKTFIPD